MVWCWFCRRENTWRTLSLWIPLSQSAESRVRRLIRCATRLAAFRVRKKQRGLWIELLKGVKAEKAIHHLWFLLTMDLWKGRQLTAEASLDLISSSLSLYIDNGRVGSCIANTLTTMRPSWLLALATLKNLVLPRLWIQRWNNAIKLKYEILMIVRRVSTSYSLNVKL